MSLIRTDKEIVLLDHQTASLSESQEKKLFQFLRSEISVQPTPSSTAASGKVLIVTSNRFSTAVYADHIIVLANGRIAQEGTYKDLMSCPGPFRDHLFPIPLDNFKTLDL